MKSSLLFEELVVRSWWTILFFLICFFAYDQAINRREREQAALEEKLSALIAERSRALEHQEHLKLQIASQDDEAWIELTLMRRLGLVPEGYTKILYTKVEAE